jgi:NTP pyrophosphatase (non-canonical NTP hydrolase)
MDMSKYQSEAMKTAIYPKDLGLIYTALGLCGEAGEVAEKVKKYIRDSNRDDKDYHILRSHLIGELGDVLWYVANLAIEMDLDLSKIAEANLYKLKSRQERNKLGGSGDDR